MAQKTTVQLVDDLDGTAGADIDTITFSLDGVVYEIDLNSRNATKLRDGVAAFVIAARRTGGRIKRGPAGATAKSAGSGRSKEQTKAMRDWAKANGYTLSDRGRIPETVIEAFETAHTAKPKTNGEVTKSKGKKALAAAG